MALVSGFSGSGHAFPPGPPAYSHSHSAGGAEMDDDLLALLASDTFSLQSHRDRDLDLLSSLLAQSLPPNSSPPASSATGNWIPGHPAPPSSSSSSQSWNGWTPSTSSSSGSGSGYYAPSTSFSAGAGGSMATPHGTPLAPTPLTLAASPSTAAFPFSSSQSAQSPFVSSPPPPPTHADWARIGREAGGCRAPAASRERGRERGGSIQYEQSWASGMPGAEEDAAMMDD